MATLAVTAVCERGDTGIGTWERRDKAWNAHDHTDQPTVSVQPSTPNQRPVRGRSYRQIMTDTLRHPIVFAGAIPSAVLARDAGLEPTAAATVAAMLPALRAAIDLAVRGPDLTGCEIAGKASLHTAAAGALACTLTALLQVA